jgi:hypothetical protein
MFYYITHYHTSILHQDIGREKYACEFYIHESHTRYALV